MASKFFVRLDTYWQGSPDRWIGPYPTLDAARAACDDSGAGRADLGQMAGDVKNQTRVLGIHNGTKSRHLGRRDENTIPAQDKVPSSTAALRELERDYLMID